MKTRTFSRETCHGKIIYPSEKIAKTALNYFRTLGRKRRPNRAYSCEICGRWHITASKIDWSANTKKEQSSGRLRGSGYKNRTD